MELQATSDGFILWLSQMDRLAKRVDVERLRPFIIPGILGILTLVFMMAFIRSPTGNEVLDGDDLLYQQYPLYSFIFDSVRAGHGLPLWNPYLFAGQSIVGNPQSTIVYPPAWLMAVFGVPKTVGWLAILHLWLSGWGIATLARQLGASRSGALIGGMIFEFSGLMSTNLGAGHFNHVLCETWLAWLAAAYLWSLKQRNWFRASLAGVAVFGILILTGYPPFLYFAVLWLGGLWIYTVGQAWCADRSTALREALRSLRPLLVIGIGGSILGAAMLLPVMQLTLQSTRSAQSSLAFSNSFPLPAGQLITLIFPNLFGYPKLPDMGYWGVPFYQESTFYFGIFPLATLILVPRLRQRQAALLFILLAGLGLVISLGIDGGLFPILYWLLPGYSLFRVPSKALHFVLAGVAGLSALLISDLQALAPEARNDLLRPLTRWVLPLLATFALATSVGMMIYFTAHSTDQTPPWRMLYSGNIVGVAVVMLGLSWIAFRLWQSPRRGALIVTGAIILIDLWHIAQPQITVSAVDVPEPWGTFASVVPASNDFRALTIPNQVIWQNGSIYTHHLNASGYDPLVNSRFQLLLDSSQYDPTSPVARLLGVRYAITDRPYDSLNIPGKDQVKLVANASGWHIYETADPLPHAFVASQIRFNPDDAASRQQIAAGAIDPLTAVTVDRPVTCPANAPAQSQAAAARIVSYQSDIVEIDASGAGVLVLTDAYDSNWTVTVDNQPAQLLRVDTTLRGVCLGAGSHHVRFVFRPTAFYLGLAVSGAGWVSLGLLALILFRRSSIQRLRGSTPSTNA